MKRQIDNVLRDWAERQKPDEAARRQLKSRILQAADRAANLDERTCELSTVKALSLARGHQVLWFAAGVAATLLVAGIWHAVAPVSASLPTLLRQESGMFADRRRPMSRIFCETERLFGTKLQWVALSGSDAGLGLTDKSNAGEPLVVRVVVVARPLGSTTWERLWEAEVVARANGILELVPDGRPDNHLALWLYRLEDDAALVESRLTLRTPVVMQTETSEILTFGATHKVSQLQQGGVEYLLLQTIAPVAKGTSCTS